MKAEKAELFELFLHDEHGIGLVEFTDFNDRSVSKRNGIKLNTGTGLKYIAERKIDSYFFSRIKDKYIIACTNLDSKKAIKMFTAFMTNKCKLQIEAHKRINDQLGFLSTWEKRLEILS